MTHKWIKVGALFLMGTFIHFSPGMASGGSLDKPPKIDPSHDERYEEGFCAGYNLAVWLAQENIKHFREHIIGLGDETNPLTEVDKTALILGDAIGSYVKPSPLMEDLHFRDGTGRLPIRCSKYVDILELKKER